MSPGYYDKRTKKVFKQGILPEYETEKDQTRSPKI